MTVKQVFKSFGLKKPAKLKIPVKIPHSLQEWLLEISDSSRPYSFHILEALRLYESIYLVLQSSPELVPESEKLNECAIANTTIAKQELSVLRSLIIEGSNQGVSYHLRRALLCYRKLYNLVCIYDLYRLTKHQGREAIYELVLEDLLKS